MLTTEDILRLLPHRFPMLLIDRVLELDTEAVSLVAIKNVSHNEPFFTGHFPDRPVMPGVLMIEAMAQAALLCIFGGNHADPESDFLFAGIEQAKFRRAVVPGDQLRIEVKLIRQRGPLWKVGSTITVDGEAAVEAVLTAYVTAPLNSS
ncbi:MAG: 3-hydroxyacyl-ACP dehydratase FabZ [Nitrospinota bacterium]|nr:3-hydroxyacyl-ACP dehydratase FabZ [Nitrospinota bacterium]MDP7369031.1 3-hydroxyacyl-ACP dehydratase FabZ [Nitrospinota bacterium]MDP7663352.1 3-hydroxyacyl-ACP dehydratase FabZ [Nitrospinota bacterium]